MSYRTVALTLALVASATMLYAQQPLQLRIANGRVTLHAQNVPVRTILAEWARIGGARIVNGDRVVGAPVTLELENVPERQALDIVLRGVSGYMLAAREPGAGVGASMFDRIMILPTSTAPRNPPPAPTPILSNIPGAAALIRPIVPPRANDASDDDTDPGSGNNDGVPIARPVPLQRPVAIPGVPLAPPAPLGEPDDTPPVQTPPGVVVSPTNPFGLPPGSSDRPGVIAPAPQPTPQAPRPDPDN